MNKWILILVLGFLFIRCNSSDNKDVALDKSERKDTVSMQDKVMVNHVDAISFKKMITEGNGIILDVRTPEETAQGYIKNASIINFYDEDFDAKINWMQKDKPIYVYCKSGGRSIKAAQKLIAHGFKEVYNLDGGLMAWEKEGYEITPATETIDANIEVVTVNSFNELLKRDKPILVDFHTVWCAPCKKMAPIIDEIEKEFEGKAIVKRIDADASKELAKAYDVQGVPVFILFVGGKQIWSHNGIIAKEELVQLLAEHIK